jgi:hypothetical protein
MQIIQGRAEKLRVGVEVSSANDQVKSTHVATLMITGKAVRMEMPSAFHIAEGDQLKVAGLIGRDGVLKAYAYRNVDNGARGWAASFGMLLGGLISSVFGAAAAVVTLSALLGSFGDAAATRLGTAAVASIFMLGFGFSGIRLVKTCVYSSRAKAAVG